MSQAIPHWTPEMLDAYNLKLSKAKGQIIPPPKKLPGKKPKFGSVEGKLPAGMKVDLSDLVSYQSDVSVAVPFRAAEGKQSKTEQKYNREVLGGNGRFEAVTLHLPGGGRYTPDFMTIDDGVVTFHEVKGSYRLGSQAGPIPHSTKRRPTTRCGGSCGRTGPARRGNARLRRG